MFNYPVQLMIYILTENTRGFCEPNWLVISKVRKEIFNAKHNLIVKNVGK